MNRKNIWIFFILSMIIIECSNSTSPVIEEDNSANLRLVNLVEYYNSFNIYGNDTKLIDSLSCNDNSGYLPIKSDSLRLTVFNISDSSTAVYDTLFVLSELKYYTLFLIKNNRKVTSCFVEDIGHASNGSAFVRFFNNSQAGQPFEFSLKSDSDTVYFTNPPLFKISSYKKLKDKIYIPSLMLLSNNVSADYEIIRFGENKNYTIVITDTEHIFSIYYPYKLYLLSNDFNNN